VHSNLSIIINTVPSAFFFSFVVKTSESELAEVLLSGGSHKPRILLQESRNFALGHSGLVSQHPPPPVSVQA